MASGTQNHRFSKQTVMIFELIGTQKTKFKNPSDNPFEILKIDKYISYDHMRNHTKFKSNRKCGKIFQ